VDAMADFARDWQELIGAVLGGLFALATALIVAGSARRRDQRAAAAMLVADVLPILAAATNLRQIADAEKIDDKAYPGWLVDRLSWRRPHLSSLFDEHRARVIDVDTRLSAHLTLLKMIYGTIEDALGSPEQLARARTVPASLLMSEAERHAIARSLELAGVHAQGAEHFLSIFVLSRWPPFVTRLRIWLKPSDTEKKSAGLLIRGSLDSPSKNGSAT